MSRSGKGRKPTEDEAKAQQVLIACLAQAVGDALWARKLGTGAAATFREMAVALGHNAPTTLYRASLPHTHKRAVYVRPATLKRWEESVQQWISREPEVSAGMRRTSIRVGDSFVGLILEDSWSLWPLHCFPATELNARALLVEERAREVKARGWAVVKGNGDVVYGDYPASQPPPTRTRLEK